MSFGKFQYLAIAAASLAFVAGSFQPAAAQPSPFASGWELKAEASALRFRSVKNETKMEVSSFATFSGAIDTTGRAKIEVLLDSVDTKVDLRNVRMRFLFFETFQYPKATIELVLDPADFADLSEVRRKALTLPYTLDLHGITKNLESEVEVVMLTDDLVTVSSTAPIPLQVADFALQGGIEKLQNAANVRIIPSTLVSFDFVFARGTGDAEVTVASVEASVPAVPAAAALETQGNFSLEACKGRFEILSRTDNIYFDSGSARLDAKSRPLLDSIIDIVQRCPGLVVEVAGHTDSDGGAGLNQRLSEARARSVSEYLTGNGVDHDRIVSIGFGESRPVAPNDTAANKRRNRRIEFAVAGG